MSERDIFLAALEIQDCIARDAWLTEQCGADAEMRGRVEALLQAHAAAGEFLEKPAAGGSPRDIATTPDLPQDHLGTLIAGKYKLLQVIGEGGMGAVYMADQTQPIKRRVAVKLIKAGMDSRNVLARFESERQALALMGHPNIAKVLDAGTTGLAEPDALAREPETLANASGSARPFFVMELVKGIPLTEYCDQNRLSVGDRLALFRQICSAVHHAHQKGIIHRDLKPSNILVESHDGKPVPKVIDFGLAKAVSGMQLTENTLFTALGTVAGTPLYMAPEQAAFNAIDIDTRADIFALGVILYELLTGSTPITRDMLKKAAFDELLRVVREQEPPTPSKRISTSEALPTVAANRQMEPIKLGRFVKGDLDWIVMKALARERDRRYESATAFAQDIERFLNHEPVSAGPPTVGYKLRKFVKRNRVQVVAGLLVFAALVLGIAGTTFGLIRAGQQRQIAEENEKQATNAADAEREAKDQEAKQRVKAEKARDRTRQALDAMTSSITGDSLSTQKAISVEQKKFLSEVLTYYQEFAGEQADDEPARARTAAAAFRVGLIEFRVGRKEKAVAAFGQARDGYAKLAAEFPAVPEYRRDLARSHNCLGLSLNSQGKLADAKAQYQRALAIFQRLANEFRAVPEYRRQMIQSHNNLGPLLASLGKNAEAEEQFRQALTIGEQLDGEFPAVPEYRLQLSKSRLSLGALLATLGKRVEAEEQFRQALTIVEQLTDKFPAVPEYRLQRAKSHLNLGRLLMELGKRPEAEHQHRQAGDWYEKLAVEFPAVPEYRRDLAISHNNLGILLREFGKRAEAEEQYRLALEIREKLTADFPSVPEYRYDLAQSHNNLGLLLFDLGKRREAEEQCHKALAVLELLVADFPDVPDYQVLLGVSYSNFARLIRDGGQLGLSLEWFAKAVRTLTPVYERDHRLVMAKAALRNSHWSRAIAYDRLRKYAEAVNDWDKAIELSSTQEQPSFRASRATAQVSAGRVAEAVAEVAELTQSSKWNAGQWYDFACVYAVASGKIADKKQEYADRAMELLRKAVQAGWKDAAHMAKDSDLDPLRDREDFKKLMAELQANIAKERK
jgi:serine/threonine protein kinase/tetratricopeptide (TPR) repeat protein